MTSRTRTAYKKNVKHNVALSIRGKRSFGAHGWTWRHVPRPEHRAAPVSKTLITNDACLEVYTFAARRAATYGKTGRTV